MDYIKIRDCYDNIHLVCVQLISKLQIKYHSSTDCYMLNLTTLETSNFKDSTVLIPLIQVYYETSTISDTTFAKLSDSEKKEIRDRVNFNKSKAMKEAREVAELKLDKLLKVLKRYSFDIEEVNLKDLI